MSHLAESHAETDEAIKYARTVVAEQMVQNRTGRASIFAWASALLVAITGGVVALTYRAETGRNLQPAHRIALTIAVLAVAADAAVCMRKHWKAERVAGEALGRYDRKLGIPHLSMPGWPPVGDHGLPLALLTAAAMLVIWLARNN